MSAAVKHLATVKHIVQAARDTEHRYPGSYVDGINAGLDIALRFIDLELQSARDDQAVSNQLSAVGSA